MNSLALSRGAYAVAAASITLRLFHRSDPACQIDERTLDGGELVIGRDGDVDWPLQDSARKLSRRHCSVSLEGGMAMLRDLSANGVFVGAERARAPFQAAVVVELGETLELGDYLIVLEENEAPFGSAPLLTEQMDLPLPHPHSAPDFIGREVENSRLQPAANSESGLSRSSTSGRSGALLEAFCAGAHLDITAFADEDSAALMRRLGGVYHQMIIGLAAMMRERSAVKADYMVEHTTIRPAGNNPFRWADPKRVAVDLLRDDHDGFISGSAAVKASFNDLRKHLDCVFAGFRSTLDATLEALSPKSIEGRLTGRSRFFATPKSRRGASTSPPTSDAKPKGPQTSKGL